MPYPRIRLIPLALAVALLVPLPAFASNEALLKLLRVLRDRGSITTEEYEEIRLVAEQSTPTAPPAAAAPAPQQAASVGTDDAPARPQPAERAPARAWYERLGMRGYTQFRYSKSAEAEGPPLNVPADRSVDENETFVLRRGRLVLSGDVTDRLSLYAQSDFSGSTGAADFSLQMRDLYADVWLNPSKTFRIRVGQSKVPYGWSNLQSSQNRLAMERPDAINSAAEGERDLGAYLMWAAPQARQRFRDLVGQGLKGSGDYGVVAFGAYAGQGPNRSDQNGQPHVVARVSYPFRLESGQFFEIGAQAHTGRFVSPTQAITLNGETFTPAHPDDGVTDQRVGVTAVWYPQPFGVEAEWNVGRGPRLSDDFRSVTRRSLDGGYLQVGYRRTNAFATWYPFLRWSYFDGGRKFGRNAPHMRVNELDFGLELAKWAELETTIVYTRTFERTRTNLFPYALTKDGNRIGFQVQWNY